VKLWVITLPVLGSGYVTMPNMALGIVLGVAVAWWFWRRPRR
jgi:hypothetical protein